MNLRMALYQVPEQRASVCVLENQIGMLFQNYTNMEFKFNSFSRSSSKHSYRHLLYNENQQKCYRCVN